LEERFPIYLKKVLFFGVETHNQGLKEKITNRRQSISKSHTQNAVYMSKMIY